jgi:hypothetical protein
VSAIHCKALEIDLQRFAFFLLRFNRNQVFTLLPALYTGDFMVGFSLRDSPAFDDWQFSQAESLRRTYVDVLQRLVLAISREGNLKAAIDYTRRWLAVDPLHEPAHRQLMQLYTQTGERTLALRQYRECVRILEQELGVPPLDETTNLYQMIQANQLSAASVQPSMVPAKSPSGRYPASSPTQPRPVPLVGRLPEWTTLQRRYTEIGRAGHLIVLEGEAGIGKTRLAEEFVAHVRSQGATVITARCYSPNWRIYDRNSRYSRPRASCPGKPALDRKSSSQLRLSFPRCTRSLANATTSATLTGICPLRQYSIAVPPSRPSSYPSSSWIAEIVLPSRRRMR